MPWGSFPLIGIVLGPICGFLQYKLLTRLILTVKDGKKSSRMLLLLFSKLALYALFLVPPFLVSMLDGVVCGILAGLTMVGMGIFQALRKGGEDN